MPWSEGKRKYLGLEVKIRVWKGSLNLVGVGVWMGQTGEYLDDSSWKV